MTATIIAHRGLEIQPVPTALNTDIYVQCAELLLMSAGDWSGGAQGATHCCALVKDATPMRVTNVGFNGGANGSQVSTSHTGSLGMDAGPVQPNSDIWLWAIGNSTTNDTDLRFSHSAAWPTMPAGYDRATPIYWNHTNGNGLMTPLVKMDCECTYAYGNSPVVASGLYNTPTHIPLNGFVSPSGGGYNSFGVTYGNAGKYISLGPDQYTYDFSDEGDGISLTNQVKINGYAGGVYVLNCTDPGFILRIRSFTDTI